MAGVCVCAPLSNVHPLVLNYLNFEWYIEIYGNNVNAIISHLAYVTSKLYGYILVSREAIQQRCAYIRGNRLHCPDGKRINISAL